MDVRITIAASVLVAVIVAGFGCRHDAVTSSSTSTTITSTDLRIDSREELDPTKISDQTVVTAAGMSRKMALKSWTEGEKFFVELLQHDAVDDREEYRINNGSFSLYQAAGETFEPVIPLLRFPMDVGEKWEWKGMAMTGSIASRAVATVTTEHESVGSCGILEAVVTNVNLTYTTGSGQKIERKMAFYFARNHGLFKREFGSTSTREPACQ